MESCNYKLEQIVDSCNEYYDLCNLFFSLASDDLMKIKLQDILYKGSYNGFSFSSGILNMDNPFIELKRRVSLAYLLIKNPETFDVLVENKVNLFHGTNSNALLSILENGLTSIKHAKKEGINITTGEKWSRIDQTRDFISFTDILDIAEYYSSISPEDKKNNSSFEVVIGTTAKDVINARRCSVGSDVPEVCVRDNFPKESIQVVFVPSDKVDYVKQLIPNDEIKVAAMDDINEKFYYIDDCCVDIFYDKYDEIKNSISAEKKETSFGLRGIRDFMLASFFKKPKQDLNDKKAENGYRVK